jgi:hypothetical protein
VDEKTRSTSKTAPRLALFEGQSLAGQRDMHSRCPARTPTASAMRCNTSTAAACCREGLLRRSPTWLKRAHAGPLPAPCQLCLAGRVRQPCQDAASEGLHGGTHNRGAGIRVEQGREWSACQPAGCEAECGSRRLCGCRSKLAGPQHAPEVQPIAARNSAWPPCATQYRQYTSDSTPMAGQGRRRQHAPTACASGPRATESRRSKRRSSSSSSLSLLDLLAKLPRRAPERCLL